MNSIDIYALDGVCAVPGCMDLPPTTNCSFVGDCVNAIDDALPDILPKDIPDSIREALKKMGRGSTKAFFGEIGKSMLCAEMNSCQCAGTCPDKQPWIPKPPDKSEESKDNGDCN